MFSSAKSAGLICERRKGPKLLQHLRRLLSSILSCSFSSYLPKKTHVELVEDCYKDLISNSLFKIRIDLGNELIKIGIRPGVGRKEVSLKPCPTPALNSVLLPQGPARGDVLAALRTILHLHAQTLLDAITTESMQTLQGRMLVRVAAMKESLLTHLHHNLSLF